MNFETRHQPDSSGLQVVDTTFLPEAVPPASNWGQDKILLEGENTTTSRRFPRSTIITLIALVVVIAAAAIGGGVGGSIAVKNAYERGLSDGATATITVSAPGPTGIPDASNGDNSTMGNFVQPPPQTGKLALDCPALSGKSSTIKAISKSFTFRLTCGIDHVSDSTTFIAVPSYTLGDCLRACASFNERSALANNTCIAVQFNADLQFIEDRAGNCFLKSKIGNPSLDSDVNTRDLHLAAQLVDS